MIVNMPNKEGVTLATQGKYCKENIEVVPTFETENTLNQYLLGTKIVITAEDLSGVTEIRDYQFYNDLTITDVELPDSVATVGAEAFRMCKNLKSINLPNSITTIENNAFWDCFALTSIYIPNSIVNMGVSVFSYCQKLSSVTMQEGITTISSSMFRDTAINDISFIPESVTKLGQEAFVYCSKLTDVVVPDHIVNMGKWVFRGSGITSAVIGRGITAMPGGTFWHCYNLTTITLPDTITAIGSAEFENAPLQTLTIFAETPPTLWSNSFGGVPDDCIIRVPAASVEAYKSAPNWIARADYIVAIEE